MIERPINSTVPEDVRTAFQTSEAAAQLSGGLVNQTFRLGDMVLQRLGQATDIATVEDSVHVMDYMTSRGWSVPMYSRTLGEMCEKTLDSGWLQSPKS